MYSFVEVLKQIEFMVSQHYSRSLYAASVRREMNKASLSTLECTLNLLNFSSFEDYGIRYKRERRG